MKTKISHAWHLCLASLTGFILAILFFNQSLLSNNSNIYKTLRSKTKELQKYFSEASLIKYRVQVEIEYFISLCNSSIIQLNHFPSGKFNSLREIYINFS